MPTRKLALLRRSICCRNFVLKRLFLNSFGTFPSNGKSLRKKKRDLSPPTVRRIRPTGRTCSRHNSRARAQCSDRYNQVGRRGIGDEAERRPCTPTVVLVWAEQNPGKAILYLRDSERSADSDTRAKIEQGGLYVLNTPACKRFESKCKEAERKTALK